MSSPGFKFKQFYVAHDRCAMKVGTDGVLLGAMAPLGSAECRVQSAALRVLDIGTGTGLVALMLAQRLATSPTSHHPLTPYHIDAIDIDPDAAAQAADNFSASPWASHLHAACSSLQDWGTSENSEASLASKTSKTSETSEASLASDCYDIIVSNPPYFQNSLKNPDQGRETARHTDTLSYRELIHHSLRLMRPAATLTLILPAESETQILALADEAGLHLHAHTRIYSKEGKPQLRTLLTWGRTSAEGDITPRTFYIQSAHSPRSEEYAELCKDFYL